MMKKTALVILSLLLIQSTGFTKDILNFGFPNAGWHQVESPDGVKSKKCFVPANQTAQNYTEMVTLSQKAVNTDLSAMAVLHRQLGKDKNNYYDIVPEYVVQDMNNAIVTWCSEARNTCAVERAFQGDQGVILMIYTNKAPHYSQNMFGQWINHFGRAEVYKNIGNTSTPATLTEL